MLFKAGRTPHWHSDNDRGISLFWSDACYQRRYYALMQEIASRFADCPAVAGYELLNEPSSSCRSGDYPSICNENFTSDYQDLQPHHPHSRGPDQRD